ncbi:Cytochrome c1 heme lyase [Colletotrichum tropicale]|nr:Cytochrome c1 heme lyase [Colletotrichum tropicale]
MFFEAMKRKGHDTRAADMRTVVPIHNAVNERAWKEIKEWEAPYTQGTACDGPRLHSFAGLSTNMSPKARLNTLLGYQAPFDRHDWVIDRCGVQVDYVIDFYAGRPDAQGKPSFYLDVRPKLNSWEGVKMRALRGAGLA